jgi:hypothetical protein
MRRIKRRDIGCRDSHIVSVDGQALRSLGADATPSAPALRLRPWGPADAFDLVELYRDDALRRWTSSAVDDLASAAR